MCVRDERVRIAYCGVWEAGFIGRLNLRSCEERCL